MVAFPWCALPDALRSAVCVALFRWDWVHLAVRFPKNAMSNELPTLPCMTLALALVACRDARRSAVFLSLLGCHSPERELITTGCAEEPRK